MLWRGRRMFPFAYFFRVSITDFESIDDFLCWSSVKSLTFLEVSLFENKNTRSTPIIVKKNLILVLAGR